MRDTIYRTSRLRRGTRVFELDGLQHVFDCSACEYAMSALTREGAETLRRVHTRTTHPELLTELLWLESPLSDLTSSLADRRP